MSQTSDTGTKQGPSEKRGSVHVVCGDLLDQPVEVIVNAWNRNVIPWWLLLPQGVSGAIKRRAGLAPFRELARHGRMRPGEAVLTGAGRLPFRGIIHAAGINLLWRATEESIRKSVENAMQIVNEKGFASVAFPIIGAGTGGFTPDAAIAIMQKQFGLMNFKADVVIVRFQQK